MRPIKSRVGLTRGIGFSESICHERIYIAHCRGVIHQTKSAVTKIVSKGSDQREELGKSRIYCDSKDLAMIQDWFLKNSPFD